MNFIILADKYHKGMKSKGSLGLLSVNSKYNIFEFQYNNIKKAFPKSKIIYVYGFDHKKIENFLKQKNKFKDLVPIYNENYETTNYGHSLKQAKEYLKDSSFITFGDILFKHQIFEKFDPNAGSQIFINSKIKNALGCTIENSTIKNISFELDNYLSSIYYIHKKDSTYLSNMLNSKKYMNYFLFELINKMIDNNHNFAPFIKNNKNITSTFKEAKIKI